MRYSARPQSTRDRSRAESPHPCRARRPTARLRAPGPSCTNACVAHAADLPHPRPARIGIEQQRYALGARVPAAPRAEYPDGARTRSARPPAGTPAAVCRPEPGRRSTTVK
jgi:hypothetical protein